MSIRPVSAPTGDDMAEPVAAPPGSVSILVALPTTRRSWRRSALRRLLRTPSATVGLLIVLLWVVGAIFWPLFVPYCPDDPDYNALLAQPSLAHIFGTDAYGRDVLSRVLAGSREVLALAPAATLLGLLGGVIIGLMTSYYG